MHEDTKPTFETQFEAFGSKDRKSALAFHAKETITSPVGCLLCLLFPYLFSWAQYKVLY